MKHTEKFRAAVLVAPSIIQDSALLRAAKHDNKAMYDALEQRGWFWDSEAKAWQDVRKSTSMFEADDGLPTGTIRLRLMAHPKEMARLVEIISEALDTYGVAVTETSNLYPNRRGPGVRCYLTAKLPVREEAAE